MSTEVASSTAQRHLTVSVAGQSYALGGESVVEVLRRPKVTRVPNGPQALLGVSNVRGAVLPVISLARLMDQDPGSEERLVVVDNGGPVGVLVDAVLRLDIGKETVGTQHIDLLPLLEAGFRQQTPQTSKKFAAVGTVLDSGVPEMAHRVLLAFLVAGQSFALPLDSVVEVLRVPAEVSRVSGADDAVLGVAEVRDHTLPILSLGALLAFGMYHRELSESRVLLVDQAGAQIGLVVDSVEAILRLPEAAVDEVPPILQRSAGKAELDAIGRQGAGKPLLSILSVPRLFANKAVEATLSGTEEKAAIMADKGEILVQEQFVVFELGPERYGLPIAAVQEVLRLPETITRLPNGPRFISGIVNLRGRPVPVIDQRQRFDAPASAETVQPRVIVVTVGDLQAGLVVDAVSEIVSVPSSEVVAAPPLSAEGSTVFNRVVHFGKDGELILLIDPAELLSRAEQDLLADMAVRQTSAGAA
ncbi:chemotaxis protein CheW [Devosia sp. RR2S18]|uniref:chemotaxis protein CheW n=1 Tax=Devosia rhizosphaerae TaxID=3049774 RepID=UPI0025402F23|nr:chemotaxis protein CheW [Devosia sp. RR2S18]WIJ25843.1 chemotaxis protein CheW [Devosia sp. RR2S18]